MGQCDKVVLSLMAIPSAQRDSGAQSQQPAMPTAARTIWEGTRTRQSLTSHQWLQEKKGKKNFKKEKDFPFSACTPCLLLLLAPTPPPSIRVLIASVVPPGQGEGTSTGQHCWDNSPTGSIPQNSHSGPLESYFN